MDDKLCNKINEMSPDDLRKIIENSDMYSAEAVELAKSRLNALKTEATEPALPENCEVPESTVISKKVVQKNGPFTAYAKMFKNYANFKGRSSRGDFWYVGLLNCIIMFLFCVIMVPPTIGVINTFVTGAAAAPLQIAILVGGVALYSVWLIAIIIPSFALIVRRLHDIGKSGWWYFISFVPFVGSIILFVLTVTKGDQNQNSYGENPLYSTKKVSSIGIKLCVAALAVLAVFSVVGTVVSGNFFGNANTQNHVDGNIYFIDNNGDVVLDAFDVESAEPMCDDSGWGVEIKLNKSGRKKFAAATKRIEKYADSTSYSSNISIFVDGEFVSIPSMQAVNNNEIITLSGNYTREYAELLADRIMYGNTDYDDYYDYEGEEDYFAEPEVSEMQFGILQRVDPSSVYSVAVENPQYSVFSDEALGVKIDYPTHFSAVTASNPHYRCWTNDDESAIFCVNVTENTDNVTPSELQSNLIEMYGGEVTYSPVKDAWFALSINDDVYCHYAYYRVENGFVKGFEFHFAGKDNLPIYSKYIDHIFASFERF